MQTIAHNHHLVYNPDYRETRSDVVAKYCRAAVAAKQLLCDKVGMAGYRDMNLYGTLYDGMSLKKTTGVEIETFEMLEIQQRYDAIGEDAKKEIVNNRILKWNFLKPANEDAMMKAAGYYLAVKAIADERNYKAISLKDVDGMKKLCGFPPAPIFMLLSDVAGVSTVPENDCMGNVTQLMIRYLTGQCGAYLEFYEFFEDSVVFVHIAESFSEGGIRPFYIDGIAILVVDVDFNLRVGVWIEIITEKIIDELQVETRINFFFCVVSL